MHSARPAAAPTGTILYYIRLMAASWSAIASLIMPMRPSSRQQPIGNLIPAHCCCRAPAHQRLQHVMLSHGLQSSLPAAEACYK